MSYQLRCVSDSQCKEFLKNMNNEDSHWEWFELPHTGQVEPHGGAN